MFDPFCPTCASRVLLTARRLLALEPTATGHRARLRCWCGTEVAMEVPRLGTTRHPTRPRPVGAPPTAA